MARHERSGAGLSCNGRVLPGCVLAGAAGAGLSSPSDLKQEVLATLDKLKKMAQSDHLEQQAQAQYPLGSHILEVEDKGARLFPFVMEDNAYRIQLFRPGKRLPMAYVKVSAEYLAHKGPWRSAGCHRDDPRPPRSALRPASSRRLPCLRRRARPDADRGRAPSVIPLSGPTGRFRARRSRGLAALPACAVRGAEDRAAALPPTRKRSPECPASPVNPL